MQQQLIVFTRYPEPGNAKTRLIPALGEEGAAMLSRQMTEHTLRQVRSLQQQLSIAVEIRFAGGTIERMQQWLGQDWTYTPQGEGDLGDRLTRSLQTAFAGGIQQAIVIGTDCPELDSQQLREAFQALEQSPLVLGPANDGGYYLIGMNRFIPELFANIAWSTSTVLQQTLEIAKTLKIAIAQLPMLSDVDYPEDLAVWFGCHNRVNSTNV
ncbi:MAG: TIGR04282 family arsenosugar biosynthesis glycosyltransferase [Oscillatoriales cyanobacterium C42_A2020_001]|nr:TIGR04282 family arsenosugar biosynthesis glycosyltransferase [Leptolyngbyaceae cyanobacterium C42_A2020_001]